MPSSSDKARRHVYWPCLTQTRASWRATKPLYSSSTVRVQPLPKILHDRYLVPENNLGTSYGIIDTYAYLSILLV